MRDCLEKDPNDRNEDDIEILMEFTHTLEAFAGMTQVIFLLSSLTPLQSVKWVSRHTFRLNLIPHRFVLLMVLEAQIPC